jgi:chaperonin GroEL
MTNNHDFDAFKNLAKAGNPTKVVHAALQDAASVSRLLITIEATVAEHPENKGPPRPPADGMGNTDS